MEIISLLNRQDQLYWINEIKKTDWDASKFLVDLIENNKIYEILGSNTQVFLLIEEDKLISFCTLSDQDCVDDESLTPWIGFVYTVEKYRGKRQSQYLINEVIKQHDFSTYFLASSHQNLYEKYGFKWLEKRIDKFNEDVSVYVYLNDVSCNASVSKI